MWWSEAQASGLSYREQGWALSNTLPLLDSYDISGHFLAISSFSTSLRISFLIFEMDTFPLGR